MGGQSPLYRFGEKVAVGSVLSGECASAILHAQHHERFSPVVAHRAFSGGSHTHHAPHLYRKDFPVNLELPFSSEEEIKLLMVAVGMQKSCFLPRSEYLK